MSKIGDAEVEVVAEESGEFVKEYRVDVYENPDRKVAEVFVTDADTAQMEKMNREATGELAIVLERDVSEWREV